MFKSRVTALSVAAMVLIGGHSNVFGAQGGKIAGKDMAMAVGGLALSGVAKWGSDKASENEAIKEFSQTVGINAKDVGNVISISGGMLSLSLIANDDTAEGMRKLSWRAPIAALVSGVVCTKTFQDIAKRVPVIGSSMTCDNEKCTGICTDCKLTKATVVIGVYRAVDVGLAIWVPGL